MYITAAISIVVKHFGCANTHFEPHGGIVLQREGDSVFPSDFCCHVYFDMQIHVENVPVKLCASN